MDFAQTSDIVTYVQAQIDAIILAADKQEELKIILYDTFQDVDFDELVKTPAGVDIRPIYGILTEEGSEITPSQQFQTYSYFYTLALYSRPEDKVLTEPILKTLAATTGITASIAGATSIVSIDMPFYDIVDIENGQDVQGVTAQIIFDFQVHGVNSDEVLVTIDDESINCTQLIIQGTKEAAAIKQNGKAEVAHRFRTRSTIFNTTILYDNTLKQDESNQWWLKQYIRVNINRTYIR